MVNLLLKSVNPIFEMSTPSTKILPSVGSTKRKKDKANVDLPEPVRPRTPTFSPGLISKFSLCSTLGRSGYTPNRIIQSNARWWVRVRTRTGEDQQDRRRTAYRITRSSHLMVPDEGQEAGGLGSTNSGGSRLISENSLIRSMAT